MELNYRYGGMSQTLDIVGDDIPALLRSAEQQLKERHPDLEQDPALPIRLSDGLLNSLAADAQTIDVGDLPAAGHSTD